MVQSDAVGDIARRQQFADLLSEEEFALIWAQADEFRDESAENLLQLRQEYDRACANPDCGGLLAPVITRDGDLACPHCGWVTASADPLPGHTDFARCRRTYCGYNPIFHLNERIANLCCTDPVIPRDLLELVWLAHSKGNYPRDATLWYSDISRILGSVIVPPDLSEKYRGKRYTKSPLTDMKKKFAERWITIRYGITGERPPPLPGDVIRSLQMRMACLLPAWKALRHAEDCDGMLKCHQRCGCRYKLPNAGLLISLFLYDIGGLELAQPYDKYLFYDADQIKPKNMTVLVACCFRFNGMVARYDDGTDTWVAPHLRGRPWTEAIL